MAFHVRDPATDLAVRRLARLQRTTITQAIREAVEHEFALTCAAPTLAERLRPLQDRFAALGRPGGAPADKAFFDALSGEP
jgi:antitoxin VapB